MGIKHGFIKRFVTFVRVIFLLEEKLKIFLKRMYKYVSRIVD